MMRVILALCVSVWISAAAGAELVYTTVMSGAEELRGWWDCQTHVLYLESGACRWVKAPTSVARCVAPDGAVAPARRVFQRVPDLPYGRVRWPDESISVGWFHEPSGVIFHEVKGVVSEHHAKGGTLIEAVPPPHVMPAAAREYLDQWAIDYAEPITPQK